MSKSFSVARLAVAALLALATCLAHAQPSFATGEMVRAAGVKPE